MIASNCDEFERATDATLLAKFIYECPANYRGCSVEIDGHQIIRTCQEPPLNDCKTANGVIYCYCNSDLCNSKKAVAIRLEQRKERQNKQKAEKKKNAMLATDDEDLEESSGLGETNNYSEERRRTYALRNNMNVNNNDAENYGKTKQIMQITLAPASNVLNLTTPRPISNSSNSLRPTNTNNVLSLLLCILMGINVIMLRNTLSSTRRIKI
uniref:CSON001543 protein n=1 Tax=Culicoides sonorensis TaxID=179676 RepID=A0A336KZT6_CULSO